jgi:ABC-type glycerol-3-phosphate transport system substrate-binding protein
MPNKNLFIALIIVIVLAVGGYFLFTSSFISSLFNSTDVNEPVTITVWGLWEDPQIMQDLITSFNEMYPNITVNYEDRSVLSLADYKNVIVSRASGTSNIADVVLVHNSWVPQLASSLTAAPSDIINSETYSSKFYQVASDAAVGSDGSVYAVPLYYDGLVLVYNIDHFAEIGQTSAPTSWEEFRRLAQDLNVYSEGSQNLVRAGAAMGGLDNVEHFPDILSLLWAQGQLNMPEDLDQGLAVDATNFYLNFLQEDLVWSERYPEAVSAFTEGRASMIFVPSWQMLPILNNSQLNVGVAPPPQALSDQPSNWASFWMYAVPQGSSNKNAAWAFADFVTSPEQQRILFDKASQVRYFGAPYADKTLADLIATDDYLGPVIETAPSATFGVFSGRSGNDIEINVLQTELRAVLDGNQTVEQALLNVKETLTQSQN